MAVGIVIILSFIAGIVFWGGLNTALEQTGTEEFCSSCHMNDVVPEYRHSVHYMNRSGVKAACADCHLPHEFIPKWTRKIKAVGEVYSHLMGRVDTKENSRRRALKWQSVNGRE